MFIGEYTHSIDDKGRLALPIKFRVDLQNGCVVTRGLDNCLFLYSVDEWDVLALKLSQLPLSQSRTRAFSRLMLAGAMYVDCDKQGRFILPEYLRVFANIKKRVVVAGLYNRLELWDEEAWNIYKNATEKESTSIAETLENLGI